MKTFLSSLLALLLVASFAKADRILVYQGSQKGRVNNTIGALDHSFMLFDIDTLQSVAIDYTFTTGASPTKTYSVSSPVNFLYDPIATPTNFTQTVFQYSNATMSPPFNIGFTTFVGNNTLLGLGGTFIAQFPYKLILTYYSVTGSGTTGTDTASFGSGVYNINVPLTRQSNASNDDLTTATTLVTQSLITSGYSATVGVRRK